MSENGSPSASASARKLHERIAAIAGQAQVKVTGHTAPTAGARPALSIADVDRVLGDLMAAHGITSDYEFMSEPSSYEETTSSGKTLKTYRVHLRSYVSCGETDEVIARELWDDGSNVSGAVSFALKRYLRALFKLAEDDDTQQTQQRQQAQRSDFTPPREARQETPPPPRPAPADPVAAALGIRYPDRLECYHLAAKLGKDPAYVDQVLDTPLTAGGDDYPSPASLKKKLEKLVKQLDAAAPAPAATKPSEPQDGAKEAEASKDPKALVCPFCGREDAPGPVANQPGRWRCWGAKGGCSKTYDEERRLQREEYEAMKEAGTLDEYNAAQVMAAGTADA